jgi:hypothetical protein
MWPRPTECGGAVAAGERLGRTGIFKLRIPTVFVFHKGYFTQNADAIDNFSALRPGGSWISIWEREHQRGRPWELAG